MAEELDDTCGADGSREMDKATSGESEDDMETRGREEPCGAEGVKDRGAAGDSEVCGRG